MEKGTKGSKIFNLKNSFKIVLLATIYSKIVTAFTKLV